MLTGKVMNTRAKLSILWIVFTFVVNAVNAQTERKNGQIAEQKQQATQQVVDTVYLYQDVDKKPSFGGKELFDKGGFYDYLQANSCDCLFEEYGHGVGSTILVGFIVDIDGSLVNVEIIKKVDPFF